MPIINGINWYKSIHLQLILYREFVMFYRMRFVVVRAIKRNI